MKYGAGNQTTGNMYKDQVGEGIKFLQWAGLKVRESWCRRRDPKAVDEADLIAEKQSLGKLLSKEKTPESMEQPWMNKSF